MKKYLKIYYTSDTHGYLMPVDYGTGKMKHTGLLSCMAQFKKDGNTLIIDGGDTIQGSPYLYYYTKVWQELTDFQPVQMVLNSGKYDYITLGNHDFNYGQDYLRNYLDGLEAKCLCANVIDHKKRLPIQAATVHILENGLRIGLIGIVTDYINIWEAAKNIEGLSITDPYKAIKIQIEELRTKCDVVVGIYHGGFEVDLKDGCELTKSKENIGYKICKQLDVDLLLTAHQHNLIEGTLVNGTYTLQLPANGIGYAFIEGEITEQGIVFHSEIRKLGEISRKSYKAQEINETWDNKVLHNKAIYKALLPFEKKVQQSLENVIGTLNKKEENTTPLYRAIHGSLMAEVINRAQLDYTRAQLSATSLPNQIVGLNKMISMREILINYPFSNTLVVIEITGKCLVKALERIFSYFEIGEDGNVQIAKSFINPKEEHYNFDYIAGIDCEVDLKKPMGQRVSKLSYKGKIIKDEDEFTLCLNSYRASGAGGYEMYLECPVKKVIAQEVSEILTAYIEKAGYIEIGQTFNYHFR